MRLRILVLCLIGAMSPFLAACGGGETKAVASSSSNVAGGTSAFTQCLSKHGVTLPSGPSNGVFPGGNNFKFQQAIQACRSKLPNGGSGIAAG